MSENFLGRVVCRAGTIRDEVRSVYVIENSMILTDLSCEKMHGGSIRLK